jgi:L-aspartate oxidase
MREGATREYDLLVLGSGIAGLTAAIHAATAGLSVVVLTKGKLEQSATRYAQGGVAAALGAPDSSELHLSDTLTAGAGLCDVEATRVLVDEGPGRVRELIDMGAVFDRTGDGEAAALALAREGGHSLPRVVHAGGDATGAEIERALVAAVRACDADVREGWFTAELRRRDGRCVGVVSYGPGGDAHELTARHTVLATGGAGQLYAVTTNPPLSTGDGIAMARRAGALLADMEFMQFHPTALHQESMPRPLLSEALRGEGAVLRDERGVAFMRDEHPLADLAPRDVVARAITRRLRDRGLDHLWLDATGIDRFPERFPTIWRACRAAGLDPRADWLPVAPAAHYLSGGVATDLDGATTLPGLWACGEAACSGVHGANRLASNSLLDGLVFAPRVVDAIRRGKDAPEESGVLRGVLHAEVSAVAPEAPAARDMGDVATVRDRLQRAMTHDAGVMRDAESLGRAARALDDAEAGRLALGTAPRDDVRELANLGVVGHALVAAAAARQESRGTHTRLDHPEASDAYLGRFVLGTGDTPTFVPLPEVRS